MDQDPTYNINWPQHYNYPKLAINNALMKNYRWIHECETNRDTGPKNKYNFKIKLLVLYKHTELRIEKSLVWQKKPPLSGNGAQESSVGPKA